MTVLVLAETADTTRHTPELTLVTDEFKAPVSSSIPLGTIATAETAEMELTPEQQELAQLRAQVVGLQEMNQALTGELINTQMALEETARVGKIEESLRAHYEFLAKHDEKTGLYNWRGLSEKYEEMARDGRLAGFIYLDVTNLKEVNKTDEYRHLGGDYAIDGYSRVTLGAVRADQDVVARIGGDEIVVLVEKPKGLEEANTKRLLAAICQRFDCNIRQFLQSNSELAYTDLAYGISMWGEGKTLHTMLLEASAEAEKLKEQQHIEKGEYRAQKPPRLSPFQQIETIGYLENC